ncbi:MAG TPA: primosomal protein N', partial [Luteimonas sp.]|nr:primosomal protein N' [Luteimonas sp.]
MPGTDIPPFLASPAVVVRVALPVPLPRLFDYLPVDDQPVAVGVRVRVPFGTRERIGVVTGTGTPPADVPALRRIISTLDATPLLTGELLGSLGWLARYTHAPLGEIFATALPASLRRGEDLPETGSWGWQLSEAGRTARASLRSGTRTRALADHLADGACGEDALGEAIDGWRAAARALAARGLVERVRLADGDQGRAPVAGPLANPEQAAAIAAIADSRDRFAPMLLDGVTGSGKTEVYLQAIADCLARGRQALVLVPEIGLTPQMLARFRARLGVTVHALHSDLNDNARARVWTAAWRGEARVIVGTRSAVFTPLPEAGLIIVDEEHDGSYKQEESPRYNGRDVAIVRGRQAGALVVLGSATPSMESYHNAMTGKYERIVLTRRVLDRPLAAVTV